MTIDEAIKHLEDRANGIYTFNYTSNGVMSEAIKIVLAHINTLSKDANRWDIMKQGMFIASPDAFGNVQVVYQSGWMDELAEEMYPDLPKTVLPRPRRKLETDEEYDDRMAKAKGIVRDITPLADKAVELVHQDREAARRAMRLLTNLGFTPDNEN